jgi:hypothetical protein
MCGDALKRGRCRLGRSLMSRQFPGQQMSVWEVVDLLAHFYQDAPDDLDVWIGSWGEDVVDPEVPRFRAQMKISVADLRRWSSDTSK